MVSARLATCCATWHTGAQLDGGTAATAHLHGTPAQQTACTSSADSVCHALMAAHLDGSAAAIARRIAQHSSEDACGNQAACRAAAGSACVQQVSFAWHTCQVTPALSRRRPVLTPGTAGTAADLAQQQSQRTPPAGTLLRACSPPLMASSMSGCAQPACCSMRHELQMAACTACMQSEGPRKRGQARPAYTVVANSYIADPATLSSATSTSPCHGYA